MLKYSVPVLAILLAGCGGSSSTGRQDVSFNSSSDISDALNKAGLACTGYKTVASGDRTYGTEGALDFARCKLENEDLDLIVWKDNGQRDNYAGMEKALGCGMGKVMGKQTFDLVVGDRWTIDDVSQTLANKISDAIGGKPDHITCDR
jgi:hypothetical protein